MFPAWPDEHQLNDIPRHEYRNVTDTHSNMANANDAPDIELGKLRDGYPALASWIAQDPDDDPLVFRKFARLSARSLLHLQARLVGMEAELDALDEEARNAKSMDVQEAMQCWETLSENAKVGGSIESKLMRKLEDSQNVMKEYCKFAIHGDSLLANVRADVRRRAFVFKVSNRPNEQAERESTRGV
jgi:hypothetical protein